MNRLEGSRLPQVRVLVVDDDVVVRTMVKATLEKDGFAVVEAVSGGDALKALEREAPDAMVLDVVLPDTDGLSVCRDVRRISQVPILMLSSRAEDTHKIIGLEVGADDYLAKPFNPHELVARVRALLRRSRMSGAEADRKLISHSGLVIFVAGRRVEVSGQEVSLTPLEFSLLHALAASPGHVLSRQDLLDRAWGQDFFGVERTVDVHIRNLRQKLARAAPDRQYISSVRGVGYRFEA
ncbi:MAG: response regulator transcription factor [Armatimonadetes bacterium]|nr:response regulator transcription factor [Armatimonadota bacterium]